jgi:fatty acid desaturase
MWNLDFHPHGATRNDHVNPRLTNAAADAARERSTMENRGRFWAWVIGVSLAVGIGGFLLFILMGAAWARWGGLGALLFLGVLMLVIAWFYDRRQAKKAAELYE